MTIKNPNPREPSRKELEEELLRLRKTNETIRKCPYFHFEGWGDQVPFLSSRAKIKLLLGGNRTGKSTAGIIHNIAYMIGAWPDGSRDGLPPPPVHILVMVRDRRKAVERVVMRKLKHYCAPGWISHVKNGPDGFAETVNFYNGSSITIGAYTQESDSHEGLDWYAVHFDEPPPYAHWLAIRRGLLDYGGKAWFTLTPRRCPWIQTELYANVDNERIAAYSLDLMDSPHISEQEKLEFIMDLAPEEQESRIHGKFSHLAGQVFAEFSRGIHMVEPFAIPDNWPKFHVIDPHDRRPAAMSWWAVDPRGRLFCYDEWPEQDFYKMKSARMSVRDYVALIRTKEGKDRMVERLMDPNFGKTMSVQTGKTLIEEYNEYDLSFFGDLDNEIALGHARIHERLKHDVGDPTIYFFSTCQNMIRGFEGYIWDERDVADVFSTRERVSEYGKDWIDQVRYLLDYEPVYFNVNSRAPEPEAMARDQVTGY